MRRFFSLQSPLLVTALQLGLLLVVIYITFIGGQTAQVIYDHRWRMVTIGLSAGLSAAWLLWRLLGPAKIPRTPLDGPLLALLATAAAATVFSINPTTSQETLVFYVIYLAFFYLAVDLGRHTWFVELTLNALIAVAGLVWLLGLLQLIRWFDQSGAVPDLLQQAGVGWRLPRLSVLGNPNTLASYIALILPLVLYKLTTARRWVTRLLLSLWLIMLLGEALLSQSRGGLLALLLATGTFIFLVILQRSDTGRQRLGRLAPRRGWLMGLMAMLGLLLFIGFTLSFRSFDEGIDIRRRVMSGAVQTLLARPLTGAGPGALGLDLIRQQQAYSFIWPDAHNLFFTFMAETGWPGVLALAWLATACSRWVWSMLRRSELGRWPRSSLAGLAALTGFVGHNLVDSQLKYPLIMMLVALLAGFWLSPRRLDPPELSQAQPSWGRLAHGAGLLLLLLSAGLGLGHVRHLKAYNEGVSAAVAGDWAGAVEAIGRAQQLAPQDPFYQRQLAFAGAYRPDPSPAVLTEAITRYRLALNGVDKLPNDQANLACLLHESGQPQPALAAMRRAVALQPHPLYRLNLGRYLEAAGQIEAAQGEYAQVIAAQPDLLQASFWQQTPARAAALPEIIDRAEQYLVQAPSLDLFRLVDLRLQAGQVAVAWRAYAAYAPQTDPATQSWVKGYLHYHSGEFDQALAGLHQALLLNPNQAEAYHYLSRMAAAQGRWSEAAQAIEAARYLAPNPANLYHRGQVAEALGQPAQAVEDYEQAFLGLIGGVSDLSRYATEIARRRPLPAEHLPCLVRIYPSRLLVELTGAQGRLLERLGQTAEARRVYHRVLVLEPTALEIAQQLELLSQAPPAGRTKP
jgi:tetratricopeptide (TPR) repeat protein